MPNPDPIKKYMAAVEALKRGKKEEASQLLAESIGVPKPSDLMTASIERLLKPDSMANDGILKLVASAVSKGDQENA